MSLVPVTTSYIDEFEGLQQRMEEFTHKFEQILINKRANIMNNKQDHYVKISEVEKEYLKLGNDIKTIKLKIEQTKKLVDTSIHDLQSQQRIIDDLLARTGESTRVKNELENEIHELNEKINHLNQSMERLNMEIKQQVAKDYPELVKYELYLGLRIEVIDRDLLKFVFNNIDPNDLNKEVWGNIDVGGDSLMVKNANPALDEAEVEALRKGYDEKRELIVFLKSLRTLLKEKVI